MKYGLRKRMQIPKNIPKFGICFEYKHKKGIEKIRLAIFPFMNLRIIKKKNIGFLKTGLKLCIYYFKTPYFCSGKRGIIQKIP